MIYPLECIFIEHNIGIFYEYFRPVRHRRRASYFYTFILFHSFFFMSYCTERVYFAPVYRYIPISTFCSGRGITVFSKFRTLRPHRRRHPVYWHHNTDHIVYIALTVFTDLTDFNSDLLVAFFIASYIL